MNYEELIKHILRNAHSYIEKFEKQEKMTDFEKGILSGLWYDIDSIHNQLGIEQILLDDNDEIQKAKQIDEDYDLVGLITIMQELIQNK